MAPIKLCLLLIFVAASVRAQDGADVSEELEAMPGASFVYMPASSNAVLGAGVSQRRTAREWPALDVCFGVLSGRGRRRLGGLVIRTRAGPVQAR